MPAPWRPQDYAVYEFRCRVQEFRPPSGMLKGEMAAKAGRRADDPGNLAGAVLCWMLSQNVQTALRGSSAERLARALGLSAHRLRKAIAGAIPWPIEYVAAIAAHFPDEDIIPAVEEITNALADEQVVLPGPRRGRAYVAPPPPKGATKPPAQAFLTFPDAMSWPHDDWDPNLATQATEVDRAAEEHLEMSAALLVMRFESAAPEEVGVEVRVRTAPGPVPVNRKIQLETFMGTEHLPFQVEVAGELDPDWAETVLAYGIQVLDWHFVTRVLDAGDDPRRPRTVEALFVTPDLDSRECLPIGRPYVASVEWNEDEDLQEVIPTLTPVLDGYAAELLADVQEGGDPHGVKGLFP